ncbi:hypothetical protein GCM10010430_17240 [Kitasatospora cystarginea]|uniref:Inclusion body protein n=1 Tax=Kitasatospora cystarginea TaxID=58350 RepID=A0ABN3DMT4_9ACTN
MKPQVNIAVVVDVIGALSDRTLQGGNLCLIDDGAFDSKGQGTPGLCTVVTPGQVVQWSALAVDLQTPVEIRSITFLGADEGASVTEYAGEGEGEGEGAAPAGGRAEGRQLDLNVWSGVVPYFMTPGVPYRYRLELQMYEGEHSVLHIDSPALMCL